ncbi:MAG: hypothetical protein K0S23_1557 [Fluviicola sp.]|jgi:hypothetical protein|uniref:T9SS type A sorting domain-containing protein n=1 Tax=Fluviicola sp. TaxID=1917219 RepID=UPI0026378DCE|nr:T9SS type A sorting domain-containing protein [Fluviicola sp.]MDF3027250.1 hypothetical protein [Fluviicola sp.]
MKKPVQYLLNTLLTITVSTISFAQIQWEKEYIYSDYAINNTVETAKTTIETSDGGYLIGGIAEKAPRMAYLAKVNANGDSLWTRYYGPTYGNFDNLSKLYRDNNNDLYGVFATGYGRLTFVKLDETNGDTLSKFYGPMGPASNYIYLAHTQLPDGDYILSYTQGSASIVKRFTPGNLTASWSHDYAGEVIAVTSIIRDGSDVVMSGYCGAPFWMYDLAVTKLAASDGTVHWTKKYVRNSLWRDQKVGLVKNGAGDYLVAAGFTHNGKVVPTVIRVAGSDGDSLSISYLDTHNGSDINFGFCDDLVPFANGFVAAGEIDQNFDDALGDPQNVGQMALFCINDNGQILNAYTMNQVGPFYNGSIYTGSHCWGLACISTSDNQVLVVGKGNYIAESNGWISAYGDAYMVKISPETLSLNEGQEFAGLSAWPNPSNGKIQISASETIEKITIYDQLGAIIFESAPASKTVDIDLSATPGLYIYKASGKNSSGTGKLLIH